MKVPRRSQSKPRRSRATLTATAALVLEPRVRHFAGRSYIGAALGVALLALGALLAVRELAVIEPMLAAEGAHAARTVVYELPVGAELHIPIEPSSDVLRFVVHAYGRPDLALTPHPARIQLDARGDRGSRSEELRADLPGLRSRVTPEDAALQVGDPIPFEVDVHDLGVGELVVKITAIDGAAGLLVRAYRREQLTEAEGIIREAALDRPKKDDVARWTWELGWDELTAAERVAVLRARWHKVGALRGLAQDLRSITVAIAPATPREVVARREDLLGRIPLRGDERIAVLVHVGTKVRFVSDEATMLRAAVRDANAAVQNLDGTGQLEVGPFDTLRSVEVSAARDVALEVRASDAGSVEWLGWASTWRTTPSRPVIVDSADDDRIVRVSLRRAMARQDMNVAHLTAHVELTGGGLARPHSETFRADRPRSRVDRYEDFDSLEAPSERVFFFLALPRGTTARITPGDTGSLDVSLAELDVTSPPAPLTTRPPDAPPPLFIAETEDSSSPFVARRPSNAAAFPTDARKVVRTARWFAPAPPPPPPATVALAHARHTDVDRVERAGRNFDGITKPFEIEADARRPLYVPIVAAFDKPTQVTISVERDRAVPLRAALHARWTLPRTMEVGPQDMRATFVIGDDLPAGGKLRLRLVAAIPPAPRAHQLVMLPWVSTRAVGPRWLAGAFEE